MVEYTKRFPVRIANIAPLQPITSDTFIDVATLTAPLEELPAGEYVVTIYFVLSNPDTNDSLYWRILAIGSPDDPIEFAVEAKDTTDVIPVTYNTNRPLDGNTPVGLILQMRKEDASANDILITGGGIRVERVS
ncbi:hypothetical protein NVP1262O_07 [Vibrio phage 1.262.O._10N.286.51.A9]|nr:hypothetical protein NVP1262O_07 [Vibrio phage 1.262.O._10N.286.51.A9]